MLLLLSFMACFTRPSQIVVLDPGHYLIVDQDTLAYDCRSAPVGDDWRPTCVRIDYSHEVPDWVRQHYTSIGQGDPTSAPPTEK